jgi:hypothetical protein
MALNRMPLRSFVLNPILVEGGATIRLGESVESGSR